MRRPSLLALLVLTLALLAAPSRAAGPRLGPLLRVTTPGSTLCPAETEPEVAVTSAGTWVGYNDDGGCPLLPGKSFTTVQLLPRGGGAPRLVSLPPLPGDDSYSGDPELAPDGTTGGVVLSTLRFVSDTGLPSVGVNVGALQLEVFRIGPDLSVTKLPTPESGGADKEFLAVDRRDRSIHLVWDATYTAQVVLQTFRSGRWSKLQVLSDTGNRPDVAVGPTGQVAVAFETAEGVAVRVSRDGGRTFAPPVTVMRGGGPGRSDPSCPLRPTIGNRQRAIKSPRVAWDRAGRLHVVASLGGATLPSAPLVSTDGVPSDVVAGQGTVLHAVSADGTAFSAARAVAPVEGPVQWNPAVAATPDGGVAVSYLQTAEGTLSSYDARVVRVGAGGASGAPVVLSSAPGELPPAQEALGNSNCYGIGDYTGLAPTPTGVVAVWPTTVGTAMGPRAGDADIAVRSVDLR